MQPIVLERLEGWPPEILRRLHSNWMLFAGQSLLSWRRMLEYWTMGGSLNLPLRFWGPTREERGYLIKEGLGTLAFSVFSQQM